MRKHYLHAAQAALGLGKNLPPNTFGPLTLTSNTFVEGSTAGTVIGTLGGDIPAGTTVDIFPNDGRVAYSAGTRQILVGLSAAAVGTFTISVRRQKTGYTTASQPFDITVTAQAPTLGPLQVNGSSVAAGAAPGTVIGAITGKTAGSTLSITVNSDKFSISGNNLVTATTWTFGAGTFAVTIRETLLGATNSPRDSSFTVTATASTTLVLEPVGKLTRSGVTILQAGVLNAGASLSGTNSTHLTISGGAISIAAGGQGNLADSYSLTITGDGTYTTLQFVTEANVYDVTTMAQIQTASSLVNAAPTQDLGIAIRIGSNIVGAYNTATGAAGSVMGGTGAGPKMQGQIVNPNRGVRLNSQLVRSARGSISGGSCTYFCRTQYGAQIGTGALAFFGPENVVIRNLDFTSVRQPQIARLGSGFSGDFNCWSFPSKVGSGYVVGDTFEYTNPGNTLKVLGRVHGVTSGGGLMDVRVTSVTFVAGGGIADKEQPVSQFVLLTNAGSGNGIRTSGGTGGEIALVDCEEMLGFPGAGFIPGDTWTFDDGNGVTASGTITPVTNLLTTPGTPGARTVNITLPAAGTATYTVWGIGTGGTISVAAGTLGVRIGTTPTTVTITPNAANPGGTDLVYTTFTVYGNSGQAGNVSVTTSGSVSYFGMNAGATASGIASVAITASSGLINMDSEYFIPIRGTGNRITTTYGQQGYLQLVARHFAVGKGGILRMLSRAVETNIQLFIGPSSGATWTSGLPKVIVQDCRFGAYSSFPNNPGKWAFGPIGINGPREVILEDLELKGGGGWIGNNAGAGELHIRRLNIHRVAGDTMTSFNTSNPPAGHPDNVHTHIITDVNHYDYDVESELWGAAHADFHQNGAVETRMDFRLQMAYCRHITSLDRDNQFVTSQGQITTETPLYGSGEISNCIYGSGSPVGITNMRPRPGTPGMWIHHNTLIMTDKVSLPRVPWPWIVARDGSVIEYNIVAGIKDGYLEGSTKLPNYVIANGGSGYVDGEFWYYGGITGDGPYGTIQVNGSGAITGLTVLGGYMYGPNGQAATFGLMETRDVGKDVPYIKGGIGTRGGRSRRTTAPYPITLNPNGAAPTVYTGATYYRTGEKYFYRDDSRGIYAAGEITGVDGGGGITSIRVDFPYTGTSAVGIGPGYGIMSRTGTGAVINWPAVTPPAIPAVGFNGTVTLASGNTCTFNNNLYAHANVPNTGANDSYPEIFNGPFPSFVTGAGWQCSYRVDTLANFIADIDALFTPKPGGPGVGKGHTANP